VIARSDAELIVESLDEPARFGEIFDRHAQVVFRYLARRIGPDDASDLLADVFLAAFEARFRYASDFSSALPWLYGITSNLLRKHFRRRAGELKMLDRLVAQSEPHDHIDAVADVIDAQLMVRAMANLLTRRTRRVAASRVGGAHLRGDCECAQHPGRHGAVTTQPHPTPTSRRRG
jgi:DNA-directed RNA polymerase specialized sigma24 family protein